MFPVLYDSAGPRVYEAVSPISAGVLLRDFATPAAGTVPAGRAWRRGLFGACFATGPGRETRTQALDLRQMATN
jgi:hypothetical protein